MIWQPFSIVTGAFLFVCGCQSAKLLSTSAETVPNLILVGTVIMIGHGLRCFRSL